MERRLHHTVSTRWQLRTAGLLTSALILMTGVNAAAADVDSRTLNGADANTLLEPAEPTRSAANDAPFGLGNFRALCEPSHLAYDDPIVAPGSRGTTHLHLFFGNRSADGMSTFETLRSTGDGSCSGGSLNRSAYWAPALLDGDSVVLPDDIAIYYKNGDYLPSRTGPLPDGLRMIAGFDMASPEGAESGPGRHWDWYCSSASQPEDKSTTIPNCPADEDIIAQVRFPSCWDGVHLDSHDHRSHLAFHFWDGTPESPVCPTTHPVVIPQFTITFVYPNLTPGETSTWFLSSDRMPGMAHANGSTLHADWFGAWDPVIAETFRVHCIAEMLDCSTGDLGNGTRLVAPAQWQGPTLLPLPLRPPAADDTNSTSSTSTSTPTTSPTSTAPTTAAPTAPATTVPSAPSSSAPSSSAPASSRPPSTTRPRTPVQPIDDRAWRVRRPRIDYSPTGVPAPSRLVNARTWRVIRFLRGRPPMSDPTSARSAPGGGYIARVQRALRSGRYAGVPDAQRRNIRINGVMDAATRSAVRAYQRARRSHSRRTDGAIDWWTATRLGVLTPP